LREDSYRSPPPVARPRRENFSGANCGTKVNAGMIDNIDKNKEEHEGQPQINRDYRLERPESCWALDNGIPGSAFRFEGRVLLLTEHIRRGKISGSVGG
jgi:hypothetical protein